jgi:hypothetical protein
LCLLYDPVVQATGAEEQLGGWMYNKKNLHIM